VLSSAFSDPVSPVERELDRFPCLLKSDERVVSARSSCRRSSSRACSLDLSECAVSEARRTNACERRNRCLEAGRGKLIGIGKCVIRSL